ncbi:hypothetical protein SAMN04489722_10755 [Algibacter lectus]|uniref:hypothetical protein n=1 Tax=Algibacter lectus TaxID=221126 RepID=UPI0008E36866|nr:hypothetical protein [Algibacter lectus]SFD29995.1 hypothetical protein SAMN04489722_10755 [Algibacter lectus]
MNKKVRYIALAAILIIAIELIMRIHFGFCDTVLIKESKNYEYIAKPNQNRFRFGNHIKYNKFSMRNEEIDTASIKILGFGDSVINGGTPTDHDSLATSFLSKTLTSFCNKKVQFLNISAGSWGPDNCFAYLKEHGDWNAKSIFLFVSSHDAYDNMNFEKIVDVNKSYPSKQYSLALYELVDRYILPRLTSKFEKSTTSTDNLGINKKTETSIFNTGFSAFHNYSKEQNIPLTIYLHAEKEELKSKNYNKHGQKIIEFARVNNIPIILDLENGLQLSDFRDGIHINNKGQKKLANIITKYLKQKSHLLAQ